MSLKPLMMLTVELNSLCCEAEHRRLTWLKSSFIAAGWSEDGFGTEWNPLGAAGGGGGGSGVGGKVAGGVANTRGGAGVAVLPPALRAAERMLGREREELRRAARRLGAPQLAAIFHQWEIPLDSKRRKAGC